MSKYSETLNDRITEDFNNLVIIIKDSFSIDLNDWSDELNSWANLHKLIYIQKEITTEFSTIYFSNTLNSYMEFLWALIHGKYRLASMALRISMETFAKGVIETLNHELSSKFSQNIEVSSKMLVEYLAESYSLTPRIKKRIRKDINSKYPDELKKIYWNLCDIVHANKSEYNSFDDFFSNMLILNRDEELLNDLLSAANKILQIELELLLLTHKSYLQNRLNFFVFEDILNECRDEYIGVVSQLGDDL